MGLIFVLLRSSENADAFGKCAMRSAVLKVVIKGHMGRYGTTLTNELNYKISDVFYSCLQLSSAECHEWNVNDLYAVAHL